MNYIEEAAFFECAGDMLLGIVTRPEVPALTGVVVVTGGPQYRVGSHRQFVLLSRKLAQAGYPVLRFDYRGMGDSEGQQRDFQQVSADIRAAIDALQKKVPTVGHVALWGLCDGASAALLYCFDTQDSRVNALCLLNPWIRSETSLARTQIKHYYKSRLRQPAFWMKALRGGIRWDAIGGLMRNLRLAIFGHPPMETAAKAISPTATLTPPFQQRMAMAWHAFPGSIFLLLSDDDYTAKEFLEHVNADTNWENVMKHPRLVRHELPGADHTFSSASYRSIVEDLTLKQGLHMPLRAPDIRIQDTYSERMHTRGCTPNARQQNGA